MTTVTNGEVRHCGKCGRKLYSPTHEYTPLEDELEFDDGIDDEFDNLFETTENDGERAPQELFDILLIKFIWMQSVLSSMKGDLPLVGDSTETKVTVTEELVQKYSNVTGDDNPLHLNEEYASETMFGGQIAHGMLAMGFVSAALAEYNGVIVYLSQEIQFEAPVSIGTEIIAECEIVESLGDNQYRVSTVVSDADDSTRYIAGEATIMINEEPALEDEEMEATS